MDLTQMTGALTDAFDSDVPRTRRAAAQLGAALTERLNELGEWCDELRELLDDIDSAAGELADADGEDRPGAHTSWVEAADKLRHHLVSALPAPTATLARNAPL